MMQLSQADFKVQSALFTNFEGDLQWSGRAFSGGIGKKSVLSTEEVFSLAKLIIDQLSLRDAISLDETDKVGGGTFLVNSLIREFRNLNWINDQGKLGVRSGQLDSQGVIQPVPYINPGEVQIVIHIPLKTADFCSINWVGGRELMYLSIRSEESVNRIKGIEYIEMLSVKT